MKKIKTLAVSAMVLAMGSMVFANPKSNTKKATVDLFEDGVVDSLKTGVEDNKGFAAVGYGSTTATGKNFNVAAGSWFADSLWFGLAYNNNNALSEVFTNKTTYTYAENGTTIVDTTKAEKNDKIATASRLTNNVSANVFLKEIGLGGEVYWEGYHSGTKDNSDVVTDTQSTQAKKEEHKKSSAATDNNKWGVNFAGFKTAESGDLAFYVGLDNVEFKLNNNSDLENTSTKVTKYGDVVGQVITLGTKDYAEESSWKTNYTSQEIGGAVQGTLGLTLPDVGIMTPKFLLTDKIEGAYTDPSKKSGSTTVKTTYNEQITTEENTKYIYGGKFNLKNTATPAVRMDFATGDVVKVAAKFMTPVSFEYARNGADVKETETKTTTKNLLEGTTKTKVEKVTTDEGSQVDTNTYTVNVKPELDLGLVWVAKPGKVNVNFGVKAVAGTFDWTTVDTTPSKAIRYNKTVETNEFGVETVEVDSATARGTSGESSSVCTYTVSSANVEGNLGVTVFMGDYVSLDMLLSSGQMTFDAANIFTDWNFDVLFSVKF